MSIRREPRRGRARLSVVPLEPREPAVARRVVADAADRITAWVAVAAAALVVVGSFLPWIRVSTAVGDVSRSGVEGGEGFISLLAGLVIAAVAARRLRGGGDRTDAYAVGAAALAAGGLLVYEALDIGARFSVMELAADVDVGHGVGLVVLGVGVAAGFLAAARILTAGRRSG